MVFDHLGRVVRARMTAAPDAITLWYHQGGAWRSMTGRETLRAVDATASWLIDQGVEPGDRIVIFAPNSPWWTIVDLAAMSAGAIPVPIYATNTAGQAAHIVRDSGATIAFAGGVEQYEKLSAVRGPGQPLRRVVAFDDGITLDLADSCPMSVPLAHPLSPRLARRLDAAGPDDIATIIYTSGTTGEPKGVVLTHANMLMQFEALDRFFDVSEKDRSLCFLPLSHAYERAWSFYVLYRGAHNYYLEDPKRVIDAMQEVRPTCMVSVPRLYEKVHSTARHKISQGSSTRRAIFGWAIGVGTRVGYAKKDGRRIGPVLAAQHALADRLVLRKIRDIVGGPKNFFSAGGAALSAEIEEFFFAAGLLVCQGYGLTETAPMITCNRPGDFKFGTVGKVIPGAALRVGSDGELLARGCNVMRGYYRMPEETAEAFEDGWFKTGDIGSLDADGFVRITDRKKDLIITSGGKKIAPSRIESVIGQDYYIEQVAAVGDGRHHLVALIVPQFEALEAWARERGITYDSVVHMVKDARIVAFIGERIEQRQSVLAQHERVKKFTLLSERFSQMGGELTPTLKNIRAAIAKKYAHAIESMYSSNPHDPVRTPNRSRSEH